MRYLRKIKMIDGFRCFSPFSWSEENCELFDRYNLVYGWNGTGKSTLSTFLHMFEQNQTLVDGISFDITCEDENGTKKRYITDQYKSINLPMRVFYDRYIEDNIQNHDRIKHIFIVGKEQNDNVKKLEVLKAEIASLQEQSSAHTEAFRKKKLEYDQYCTKQASTIKREAGLNAS